MIIGSTGHSQNNGLANAHTKHVHDKKAHGGGGDDPKMIVMGTMNQDVFETVVDVKKKYDEMIFGDKIGMEKATLLDFREYLQTYF